MSCHAGSDLKLLLLLLLASNPKYSHSAVYPPWPAGSKTSIPNPTLDCFTKALWLYKDTSQDFCLCFFCTNHTLIHYVSANLARVELEKKEKVWFVFMMERKRLWTVLKLEKNQVYLHTRLDFLVCFEVYITERITHVNFWQAQPL